MFLTIDAQESTASLQFITESSVVSCCFVGEGKFFDIENTF